MKKIYVTLNPNSPAFYTYRFTMVKGDKIEKKDLPRNNRDIQEAIKSGHLIEIVEDDGVEEIEEVEEIEKVEDVSISDKWKLFLDDIQSSGKKVTVKKILSAFSIEELTSIASEYSIIPEEGDTNETLAKAIIEEINS